MKKAVVTVLGILSVISIVVILPAIQGFRVETRMRDKILSIDKALGRDFRVKIIFYKRGWFRSNVKISCAIGRNDKSEWMIPIDIIHGPFPIAEVIGGTMSPRFFDAQLESHFTPSISNRVIQKALEQSGEPLVNISATFGSNESIRMAITSPSVSVANKDFAWKGASITLRIDEKPKDINIDARVAGFFVRTADRDMTLKVGKINWFYQDSGSHTSIKSDLGIENFYREGNGSIFELEKLKAGLKTDRGEEKLHFGNGSASIKKLRIKRPEWGVDWTVNSLLLYISSSLVEGKYDIATQGRVQQLATPNITVGPLGYSLSARELDPATVRMAMSRFKSTESSEEKQVSKKEPSKKEPGDFFVFVRSVLSKGSPRIDGLVNIKDKEQRGKIGVHLVMDSDHATSIESFNKLPDAATGNLNLRFSKGLFTKLWDVGTSIAAKVTESKMAGDSVKIESEAKMHIQKLLKAKLIVPKEDNYVSMCDFNQGTITVNRLPFDILRILADMMAKDPSEITVDFGKLGVRGGLGLDEVSGPIATLTTGLKSCVQEEIKATQHHPRGVVHVKWRITKAGQSESPGIIYSTVVNDTLEACVLSLFSSLKFPTSNQKTRAILVIGFDIRDIAQPTIGLKIGMLHHYKNPFPVGTAYTVGPVTVKR